MSLEHLVQHNILTPGELFVLQHLYFGHYPPRLPEPKRNVVEIVPKAMSGLEKKSIEQRPSVRILSVGRSEIKNLLKWGAVKISFSGHRTLVVLAEDGAF